MIYLLQEGPFLKIGYSGQVPWDRRLHQIRNASPRDIVVLAARPGTLEQEQDLHAGAVEWKHKGDWYNDCPALRKYVSRFFYPDEGGTLNVVPSEARTDGPQEGPETVTGMFSD